MRIANRFRIIACLLAVLGFASMPGVRDLLGLNTAKPPSAASEPPTRGGVRSVLESASSSSSSKPAAERSIRKRIGVEISKPPEQPLTKSLKKDWARGQTGTSNALKYARDAKASGATDMGPMAETTTGTNNFRKMKRAVGYPKGATPKTYVDVAKGSNGFLTPHPILDPVDAFTRAIKNEERRFHRFAKDLDSEVPAFWAGVNDSPLYTAVAADIDTNKSIPGWIHGDGAPTNKVDGLFTISWGCVLARGSTATSRFIYTVVKESDIVDGALEKLFDHLAYSMNILARGVYPEFDFSGRPHPLAGQAIDSNGWRMSIIFLKGDWEFLSNIIHLPRWDNTINMCAKCGASNTIELLLCTRQNSINGWRSTKRTHDEFIDAMRAQGRLISSVWKIVCLTVFGLIFDILHALDLGISPHVTADIFIEVMDTGIWGATQDKKLEGLQADLHQFYLDNRRLHRVSGELLFARIRTTAEWPKLKCKGAQMRHLCKFALKLAKDNDSGSQHDSDRLLVIKLLNRYYDIIENDPMFHPESSKNELVLISKAFYNAYKRLAKEALDLERRAWKMPAKTHVFQHLCEDIPRIINARFLWCYPDEDLQKLVKEVAETLHSRNIEDNTLYKLVVYMESDFE